MISPRGSTIFSVPCRQAVFAEEKEVQRIENKRVLGRSLSEQTLNIIPKIRELDKFLELHSEYQNDICESHPELCFAKLKGKVVLSKKNTKEGFEERKEILSSYLDPAKLEGLWEKGKELKCNPDDVMDAVCLAVVAVLKAQGDCTTVPPQPETDARGLLMQMIVPDEKNRS